MKRLGFGAANENKEKLEMEKTRIYEGATDTHIAFGIFVGAGINQKLRTIRVAIRSGTHQRRPSAL